MERATNLKAPGEHVGGIDLEGKRDGSNLEEMFEIRCESREEAELA